MVFGSQVIKWELNLDIHSINIKLQEYSGRTKKKLYPYFLAWFSDINKPQSTGESVVLLFLLLVFSNSRKMVTLYAAAYL